MCTTQELTTARLTYQENPKDASNYFIALNSMLWELRKEGEVLNSVAISDIHKELRELRKKFKPDYKDSPPCLLEVGDLCNCLPILRLSHLSKDLTLVQIASGFRVVYNGNESSLGDFITRGEEIVPGSYFMWRLIKKVCKSVAEMEHPSKFESENPWL